MTGLFLLACIAHFYCATLNWNAGFMPGHEFRQSQTALIAYYIDQQDNFSLRYETPILGKPWVSNPLEFPLYEWAVVLLSRATDVPHYKAARTVSLLCFYGTLPALFLLLRRFEPHAPNRLLILALVLTCPVYIFYSRAFLMESMALMCSAWFLWSFAETLRTGRFVHFVVCTVPGTAAALVKNTTFAVWLLPAAFGGAVAIVRLLRQRRRRDAAALATWASSCVAIPLGALAWWLNFTDQIKLAHPSAYIFSARNLSHDNFGLLDLAGRLSAQTWEWLLTGWKQAIATPWIILLVLATGFAFAPARRGPVLACFGAFLAAQLLFPFAYALQEYYFYACAAFLHAALGLCMLGIAHTRWPRWLRTGFILLPLTAQLANYWQSYRVLQIIPSHGGTGLTHALKAYLPPDSVMIIAGADWFAAVPYYAERKALMIRNGLEEDSIYLQRAFEDLADEDVAALILQGEERGNTVVRDLAVARFNLDPTPTFSHPTGDVYMHRLYRSDVLHRLTHHDRYDAVKPGERAHLLPVDTQRRTILPATARRAFPMISPAPYQYVFGYGYSLIPRANARPVLGTHPNSDVWIRPPAGSSRIEWEFGFFEEIFKNPEAMTDGVEFIITAESADGTLRQLYRRHLDPLREAPDQRVQYLSLEYKAEPGESLVFSTRGHQHLAFDSVYWSRLVVK